MQLLLVLFKYTSVTLTSTGLLVSIPARGPSAGLAMVTLGPPNTTPKTKRGKPDFSKSRAALKSQADIHLLKAEVEHYWSMTFSMMLYIVMAVRHGCRRSKTPVSVFLVTVTSDWQT